MSPSGPSDTHTVLVYSEDPAVREQVRMAAGRRPAHDIGRVEYVDVDSGGGVVRAVDAGGIDLCVLDGEAWPTGGMGISRQLKNEIADCPPCLVIIGRPDDRWLATWSQADAVLSHPLDAVKTAETIARLLREGRALAPPARRGSAR
jgi:DNA-binding response OmpR family regulator